MVKQLKRAIASLLVISLAGGSTLATCAAADIAIQAESVVESAADTAAQAESVVEALADNGIPEEARFIEGELSDQPVKDMADAEKVVSSMAETISTDKRVEFEPWRTLEDTRGNKYYVFRQMYGGVTVSGGAVKVVTDSTGKMLGIVSSVEDNLPSEDANQGITGEEAEAATAQHMKDAGIAEPQILPGYTEKVVLPVNRELDFESEEEVEEVRFAWAVYTPNKAESISENSELPYLAHYVAMDGTYLYDLPTIIPNDEAGNTGYQASYVFAFMEPAEYTGTVAMSDGTEKEISVTLMQDSRTGMYYLGNLERRIVVADCWNFLFNTGKVVLESSPDNTGWDNTALLSLYNYCRAWDYYNEIGWKGGDGLGTPIIILKDFCDKNHTPIDNAAYAGPYYGWQVFLSSSINDFAQSLDVLAHEFTHCVTGSVMTYNAYMNDYGAINEALSDIQGNICEMMTGATDDTTWEIGENSSVHIRNMGNPHKYNQPEFAWDIYYRPGVNKPTDINDRGGVHANSSLLNRIAYLLCTEGGMTLEEARDFWFAVDCSMVPGTDYKQLGELLPWTLKNLGYDKYLPALESAIEETGIMDSNAPTALGADRALLTLELPDNESLTDGNWSLYILSVDPEEITSRISQIVNATGEYAGALDDLKKTMTDALGDAVFNPEWKELLQEAFGEWMTRYFGGILFLSNGAAGIDGRTVQMVTMPGYTLPVLVYLKMKPNSMAPEGLGLAVYAGGSWFDLGGAVMELVSAENDPEAIDELTRIILGEETADTAVKMIKLAQLMEGFKNLKENFFYRIEGGKVNTLSSKGLENAQPLTGELVDMITAEVKASQESKAEG